MSIFKETFKDGVKKQLKARQEAIVERTPSAIQYFNSRNAWIRMTSSVNVGGSGELARSYVLLGGTLLNGKLRSGISISGAYSVNSPGGVTHRLGIRPMPGITNIDVKSKSAYGSLREIVVNFYAWDLRQLEELEILYMRPGYSVMVEWGWAPYLDNGKNLSNDVQFVNDVLDGGSITKEQIWENIYNKSSQDGNYDAIYGFVKNYSWSARADGGYDCSTTLITMGEILESLKVNYGPFVDKAPTESIFGKLNASYFGKNEITSKAYNQNIIAGICSELYLTLFDIEKIGNNEDKVFNGWNFYRFDITIEGKDKGNTITSKGAQIYITLKSFIDVLNKHVLLADKKAQKPVLELSVFCGKHNGGITTPLTCLGDIQQLSTDPSICQIKNTNWVDPKTNLGIDISGPDLATLKKIMETLSQDYWYDGFDKTQLGIIGNIYVNLDYIYSLVTNPSVEAQDKKEKNDVSLFDFIRNMMAGINTSIGNVANFGLFLDPVDSIARIIDVNYTGNRTEDWEKAVIIELQKLGSVVRSYKLESQIFPEQSTIIAIGAQAQGGALGEDVNTLVDFNQNLIDRIVPIKQSPRYKGEPKSAEDIKKENEEQEKIRKENLSVLIDYISKIDADFWESKGDFDPGEGSKYSNALKDQINYYRSNTNTDNKNRAIIPTKLSLEMDGIGGIVIGNLFRIPDEILPRGYKGGGGVGPAKIAYAVTGIGHSIQNNDWVTRLDAQFIILDEPKGGISTADAKAIKAGNKSLTSDENGVETAVKQVVEKIVGIVKTKYKAPSSTAIKKNLDEIEKECIKQGITNRFIIIAIKANILKETGGVPQNENIAGYGKTAITRIRTIFTSRVAKLNDSELRTTSLNPVEFGEYIYGTKSGAIGKAFGNTTYGDGYKYRGRSYIGITGKAQYAQYSKDLGKDFVNNPDSMNTPENAAATTVLYLKKTLPNMGKRLNIDYRNPSNQENANLLVTSAIAGQALTRPAKAKIFQEILAKVDNYSTQVTTNV
jgi:predicted chitinase